MPPEGAPAPATTETPAAPAAAVVATPAAPAAPAAKVEAPAAPAAKVEAPAAPAVVVETPEAKAAADAAAKVEADKITALKNTSRDEYANEIAKSVKETQAGWEAAAKVHPEYGGEKFAENLGLAKGVVENFFPPAFKTFLDASGLGKHPDFIAGMFKIGKEFGPEKLVTGRPAASQPKADQPVEKRLWPNLK